MDNAEIKQAFEDLNKGFDEFKSDHTKALEEIRKKGVEDPLTAEKLTKMTEAVTEHAVNLQKTSDEIAAMNTRQDELQAAMNRTSTTPETQEKHDLEVAEFNLNLKTYGRELTIDHDGLVAYQDSLDRYIRKDMIALDPEQLKALTTGSDPDGGYWITPEISGRIVETVFETSPIRPLAFVQTIGSKSLMIAVDDDEAGFGWLATDTAAPSETTTPKIREKEIVAFTLYAEPRATMDMLDDATINAEQWLGRKVSDRFGRAEATAFVLGTGVGQPRGFMTYANGTTYGLVEQVNMGSAADVTSDGFYDVQYSLKAPYRVNATWLMARLTLRNTLKLKDGNQQYLWQPGLQQGRPASLLGDPVRMAEDLAAIASNSLSVAYGDWREAYTIVDRRGIRVVRDNLTVKPFILFFTTRRVGGDVVNFEAFKIGKIST